MEIMRLTWPHLRNVAQDNGLLKQIAYCKAGKVYTVWITLRNRILQAKFTEGHAYGQEFETTYLPDIQPLTGGAGLLVVASQDIPLTSQPFEKSWTYTSPAVTTTIYDERIEASLVGVKNVCYLVGGEYVVRGTLTDGSWLEFGVVDRDDVLGQGAILSRMSGLTDIVGEFVVSETVKGRTSDATGVILVVGDGYLDIRGDHGDFQASEIIDQLDGDDGPDGNQATLSDSGLVEGTPTVLPPYVETEWVETGDTRKIEPGDSTRLAGGLYLRTKFYNANAATQGKVRVTLKIGRE